MADIWNSLVNMVSRFELIDLIDIILIAILIYFLLKLASKTRAMQVLRGLGILLVVARVADFIGLLAFSWALNYVISAGAVLMVILFQPEIRKALEQLGRGKIMDSSSNSMGENEITQEITRALLNLAKRREGALIVLERESPLDDIIETGTVVHALLSSQLLESIFMPGTPLHDGAVIIKGDTVMAAGCFLPLTDQTDLPLELGTRHRAALGVSEISDSITFTVSEETGTISVATDGQLTRNLDAVSIRRILMDEEIEKDGKGNIFHRINQRIRRKER
ncbi:diadenylate cyclase CdaA [Eubacteriales bacterium OttesenSCG-928-N14]|nr:diadenylate cyclase CdaA [Eubacteriales bacterium OttesenSCG-928-N14]